MGWVKAMVRTMGDNQRKCGKVGQERRDDQNLRSVTGSPWKFIFGNCSLNILMLPIFLSKFFYWQVITALTEKSMMIWDFTCYIFINSERFSHPSSQAHGFIGMRTFQILSASYFELYNTTLLIIVTLYVEEHPTDVPLLCCGLVSVASCSSVLLSLWFQDSTVCSARSDTSDFTQG